MPRRTVILINILGILLSLSKRITIRPTFHQHNAVKMLLPILEHRVTALATLALLILAYIINEDYNFLILAHEGPIRCLILLIDKATKAANHKAMGGSSTELAEGLAQIAINDDNKKLIVSNGAIPILTQMISRAKNDEERVTAANVLWVLAFDDEISQKISHDVDCMDELHKLKQSQNKDVQMVASGALWEVEGKRSKLTHSVGERSLSEESFEPSPEWGKAMQKKKMKSRSKTRSAPQAVLEIEPVKPQTHIMISYQWDVQETLIKVKNKLQQSGFNVWMDLEQMGGSTLEAMARAVENSSVVLVCVSQKYKESANCRSEAEYAFQLKKDIIPLMMQSNYKADGWLGMLMGSKLWIDFSRGQERLDTSCEELFKELGFRGIIGKMSLKDIQAVHDVQAADQVQTNQQTNTTLQLHNVTNQQENENINAWTHSDVVKWMNSFGVSVKIKRIDKKLNGTTLTLLHSMMKDVSAEYFYSSLKTDLGFDIVDAVLFKNELGKLFK